MTLSLVFLALAGAASAFQIVEELCATTRIGELLADGNWCSDTVPRCQWQGITCELDHSLIKLDLQDVPLNSTLPETLDAPGPNCHFVRMSNCSLWGEFPLTVAATKIRTLDLSRNQITGTLPWEWVPGINVLDISQNLMGGHSRIALQPTHNLRHFSLAGNSFYEDLTTLSSSAMPAMKFFDISGNSFIGRAPGFPTANTYNISGNHFSDVEPLPAAVKPSPQTSDGVLAQLWLSVCDASGNPLRLPPPEWISAHSPCKYAYDPSNEIFFIDDVMPAGTNMAGPTTEQSVALL